MSKIVNFVLFQSVWFATVIGAANGLTWPGAAALMIFIAIQSRLTHAIRADLRLLIVAAAIGLLFDSALVRSGLLDITTRWPAAGIAPLWMIVLWGNLALAINHCLAWIHARYWLAAAFGAIGGPLAYLGGAALGAGEFTIDTLPAVIVLGLFWAGVTPILFWLGRVFERQQTQTLHTG